MEVFKLSYCQTVEMSEHPRYRIVVENFVECLRDSVPDIMQKVKVHLLLHLPDNLIDFGPPANNNTERYKHLLLSSHSCQYCIYNCKRLADLTNTQTRGSD